MVRTWLVDDGELVKRKFISKLTGQVVSSINYKYTTRECNKIEVKWYTGTI